MNVCTIFGTRPEIIKMAPLLPLLDEAYNHTFIFSNQHYSRSMVDIFLEEMEVRQPDIFLGVESSDLKVLEEAVRKTLKDLDVDVVIVYGDTNSTLAAARAIGEGTKLAHIEAGIRSFDMRMPEEHNRIETDSISHLHLAPTGLAKYFLTDYENYSGDSIEIVGNLAVDAYYRYKDRIAATPLPNEFEPKSFYVLTMHRGENVDENERLGNILDNLATLDKPVIFPVHPRTTKRMKEFGARFPENLQLSEPMGYFQFMKLLTSADAVITDSGGIQEECITCGVPCVTLRDNSERMETVFLGANVLYDCDHRRDLDKVIGEMTAKRADIGKLKNPYGDGTSAQQIIAALDKHFG